MSHVHDVIRRRRTVRRFLQKSIPEKTLLQLVDAGRLSPSVGNVQPCVFIVVNDPGKLSSVFETIDWREVNGTMDRPGSDESPAAYIIVCVDLMKRKKGGASEAGAAVQSILLAATELDLGAVWISTLKRKKVKKLLRVPHHVTVESIIGLGHSAERAVAEDAENGFRVWRDGEGIVHVPKRRLADVCFLNGYEPYRGRNV
jgi:nitroreductase